MNKRNPWAWVPTLYFAEGVPYVAVMTISLIMYKRLGLSNTDITLYTSWLYLPAPNAGGLSPCNCSSVQLSLVWLSPFLALGGCRGRYVSSG